MNEKQIAANPHESLDEDGPPFEISSGPTAGHEHRKVIEGNCGNCGFDRLLLSKKHGEASKRCLLCNSYNHASADDEWRTERTTFDELKQLRKWADGDGNVEKIGEYGPRSRFTHGTEVFEHTETELLKIFEHPSSTSTERKTFKRSELRALLQTLERNERFVTKFVREQMDGKKIAPAFGSDNPNAIDAGIITSRHTETESWKAIRLWVELDRLQRSTPTPIHFDPRNPDVVI